MEFLTQISVTILAAFAVSSPVLAQESGFNQNLASSAKVVPPTTATPMIGCSTSECHPGIKAHSYLHGPLQINACDACHELEDAERHQFQHILPRQQLCLSCHDQKHDHQAVSMHEPLIQGECLACHDPHGSEQARAIRFEDRATICLECHAELTDGRPIAHAPESKGACSLCHQSHSSVQNDLLIEAPQVLCQSCHVETSNKLAGSALPHPPAQQDCRLCHDPHATSDTLMLIDDPVSLCTGCHEEIGHEMDMVVHPHAAMTKDKACLNCHQPHASEHGQLLRGVASELCYQCHDEVVEREKGGTIADIEEAMSNSPNTHSPALRGECTLCHQVHGSDRERLLRREYVPTYASFESASDYSLCFSCHDKNLVLTEKTSAVTDFRNGDTNLHFVHVNSRKSRSCNICHDPHATESSHMMRTSYPFGPSRWDLVIGWKDSVNGGSCAAGCHTAFEYDRLDAVTYPQGPGDEQDWRGRMPGDSLQLPEGENQ